MKTVSDTKGFTLIELLVFVAIIGILAAIAIPQFIVYRQKGYDAQANTDLRNAATAEEAYFTTWATYTNATCTTQGVCAQLPGLTISNSSSITMVGGRPHLLALVLAPREAARPIATTAPRAACSKPGAIV